MCGCRPEPSWSECTDVECRKLTVEAAFDVDSNQVLQDLARMDPIEQSVLLEQLVYRYPQARGAICSVAARGSHAETTCQSLTLRPHLFSAASSVDAIEASKMPGVPVFPPLPPEVPVADVLQYCGSNHDCVIQSAAVQARNGALGTAEALCGTAWPEGSVAGQECRFRMAEDYAHIVGMQGVANGLGTCSRTGPLSKPCAEHIIAASLGDATQADAPDQLTTEAAVRDIALLGQLLPPDVASDYVDFAWALWTRSAFSGVAVPNGALMALLPQEAWPHVRAAAAECFVQAKDLSDTTLRQASQELVVMLANRPPPVVNPSQVFPPMRSGVEILWLDTGEPEASIPLAFYLSTARRATSAVHEVDTQIALLEAAGRSRRRPRPEFFFDVIGDTLYHELVRWTAARLGRLLYPEYPASKVSADLSELVTWRLQFDARRYDERVMH